MAQQIAEKHIPAMIQANARSTKMLNTMPAQNDAQLVTAIILIYLPSTISTRRFWAWPVGVALEATGCVMPCA